jgi:hypothetical protein
VVKNTLELAVGAALTVVGGELVFYTTEYRALVYSLVGLGVERLTSMVPAVEKASAIALEATAVGAQEAGQEEAVAVAVDITAEAAESAREVMEVEAVNLFLHLNSQMSQIPLKLIAATVTSKYKLFRSRLHSQ